ncbi:MAG TPA: protein-L-isoaspartate(D-aspartate) O-methyltransferase [Candidatus Hodarchaeales archaeon]|nr:protein-L-isoaspartate(D-aspartate) O-methyltransferase [Candidatus Hodarchaeales archaeon]
MIDLLEAKKTLAEKFRYTGYAATNEILNAFLTVPREEFVLEELRNRAYEDTPLPIMAQQTISAPHMCVLILSYGRFAPNSGQKVMEVGTGSGYQAALFAELLGPKSHVYTVERLDVVAEFAQRNLERTGYGDRVTVVCADGTKGYPEIEKSPFDRIVITAAGPKVPTPLLNQLTVGGLLFMPKGQVHAWQEFVEIEKVSEEEYREKSLSTVAFVPLIGEHGYPEA